MSSFIVLSEGAGPSPSRFLRAPPGLLVVFFFFFGFVFIQAWFSYHFAGLPLTSCGTVGPPSVGGGGVF